MTNTLDLPTVADSRSEAAPVVPPLQNGDHLTREEFHRRYEAMGENVRAELIEGIVYIGSSDAMPSPVSLDHHGTPHLDLGGWIMHYCMKTPGLLRGSDSSVFIDGINEPQPDVLLGIPKTAGGQTQVVQRGGEKYVASAPELVAEVAASTRSIDLNAKQSAYQRNGVREYLVLLTEDQPEVRWMALAEGRFVEMDAEEDLLKSKVFPGLWLDPAALLAGDLSKLIAALDRGCATEDHRAFAASTRPT
jgi:hypothetical protein